MSVIFIGIMLMVAIYILISIGNAVVTQMDRYVASMNATATIAQGYQSSVSQILPLVQIVVFLAITVAIIALIIMIAKKVGAL